MNELINREPKGVRLNNPFNIRQTNPRTRWQGQTPDDRFVGRGYEQFETPEAGIRAGIIILRNYKAKHGLDTIAKIIPRFAPKEDNNPTGAYVRFVETRTGLNRDAKLDLDDFTTLKGLARAMIRFEQGQDPYTDATVDAGIRAALERKPPPIVSQQPAMTKERQSFLARLNAMLFGTRR